MSSQGINTSGRIQRDVRINAHNFQKGQPILGGIRKRRTGLSMRHASMQVQGANLLEKLSTFFGWSAQKSVKESEEVVEPVQPARANATLVIGATGRVGRQVVKKLLSSGETVIAGVRSADGMAAALEELDIVNPQNLIVDEGVDITDESTLNQDLFSGVTSVIHCAGVRKGDSPEEIDYKGVRNLVECAKTFMVKPEAASGDLVPMNTAEDLAMWKSFGQESESRMELLENGSGCGFTGDMVLDESAYAIHEITLPNPKDLSDFDGVSMRIKGDGQIYKMSIKTESQEENPRRAYQASFETVENEWVTVRIPWHEFTAVTLKTCDLDQPPVDVSRVTKIALILSSIHFNDMPNPKVRRGAFRLEISEGLRLFTATRPMVTILSSSGVERNALIGDDAEKRNMDIPIVKLNPGGVLNYKYDGEIAVRSSGIPYAIVRSTGIRETGEDCLLEGSQVGFFRGLMTAKAIAEVLVEASRSPYTAFKTFEVRQQLGDEAKDKTMNPEDYRRLFLGQVIDWERVKVGIPHFPPSVAPPPPPTQEEKEAIVQEATEAIEAGKAAAV